MFAFLVGTNGFVPSRSPCILSIVNLISFSTSGVNISIQNRLSVPLSLNAAFIFLSSPVMLLNARQYALTWFIVDIYGVRPGLSSIITISSGFIHISSMWPLIPYSGAITKTSLDIDASVFDASTASSNVEGVDKSLSNKYYAKLVAGHNMISFFARKVTATVNNKGKANEYTQYWNAQTDFAGFSSKVAAQLDAKIDDGRPGTGRLFGLKSEAATRTGATRQTILNSCYDGDFTDDSIKKSIYHSDTNTKYGCNLLYVMEDVK